MWASVVKGNYCCPSRLCGTEVPGWSQKGNVYELGAAKWAPRWGGLQAEDRTIESQNVLSWNGPTMIIESDSYPCI